MVAPSRPRIGKGTRGTPEGVGLARVDAVIAELSLRVEDLLALEGRVCVKAKAPVRRVSTVLGVLVAVDRVRGVMQNLVLEGAGSRQTLQRVFGGDCERIARLRLLLELLNCVLRSGRGERLSEAEACTKACLAMCDVVEGVLRDLGLAAQLAAGQQKRRAMLAARLMLAAPSRHASRGEPLLKSLDRLPACEQEPRAEKVADQLFDVYDVDGDDLLEGWEFYAAVEELTHHVLEEAEERAANWGVALAPSAKVTKAWVKSVVDPGGCQKITRSGARTGFKKVVDDIDISEGLDQKTFRLHQSACKRAC